MERAEGDVNKYINIFINSELIWILEMEVIFKLYIIIVCMGDMRVNSGQYALEMSCAALLGHRK